MSTDMIKKVYALTKGQVTIIGVGGVGTGQDAYDKIKAGASLVEMYSRLSMEGPWSPPKIKIELRRCHIYICICICIYTHILPPKYLCRKSNKKKFGGRLPPPPPFTLHHPPPPPFSLYLDSRLLPTFYTLSFLDYILEATHLPTLVTLLTILINSPYSPYS
jgi:hypothetical protein